MPTELLVVEQHAGDDERSGKWATPRFVGARYEPSIELPIEAKQPLTGRQGHGARIPPPAVGSVPTLRPLRVGLLRTTLLTNLADARFLADAVAKVIELGAVDVADRLDVDLLDLRRVQRERALDSDAGRLLAHRERLAHSGALALDHDPFEHLDPLPVALDHLEVDGDRVAGLEAGDVRAQLTLLEALDDRAHGER